MAMRQLSLFDPNVICSAELLAQSPRQAFCRIWLEWCCGTYQVRKETGAGARVLDRRLWTFETLAAAQKRFDRYIKAKTDPHRKSPRKYRIVSASNGAS